MLEDEQDVKSAYAGAKRRIAALEEQLRTLREGELKRTSCVHFLLEFMFQFYCYARDGTSNVTQGRVICRLVSMFQSVEELVEEYDRRRSLEAD